MPDKVKKYTHRVNVQADIALDVILETEIPTEQELATAVAALLEPAIDDMDGFDIEALANVGGRCYPDMQTVQKGDIEVLETTEAE
jgi:hypothetical protein